MFSCSQIIHKSVKHFKNLQQISYTSDHGNSYADREKARAYSCCGLPLEDSSSKRGVQ
jgi:hypothetical protein